MTDKLVRVSSQTWQKLRKVAYYKNKYMKTVLDDIVDGQIGPIEIETECENRQQRR
jgi:hypothetical protein